MNFRLIVLALAMGLVLSCSKDDSSDQDDNGNNNGELFVEGDGVTDADGNIYRTVIINPNTKSTAAGQEWMAENLRTSKYADGSTINASLMSFPNNDESLVEDLGYLYTWDAVMNNSTTAGSQGACPNGWHVPTVAEYDALITYLGGASAAGQKMKSTDETYWNNVTYNDNLSGFSALGAGYQLNGMVFFYKSLAKFWTSNEDGNNAREVQIEGDHAGVLNLYGSSKTALQTSCRCIKNQ